MFFGLQGKLRWTNHGPVGYSAFDNTFFRVDSSCASKCVPQWGTRPYKTMCIKRPSDIPLYECSKRHEKYRHMYHPSPCPDLKFVKNSAKATLYPVVNSNQSQCTLMMLTNLLKPDWLNIGCVNKLLVHVFCVQHINTHKTKMVAWKNEQPLHMCPQWSHILINGSCYTFVWKGQNQLCNISDGCKSPGLSTISFDELFKVKDILLSVEAQFPTFIIAMTSSHTNALHCKKHVPGVNCSNIWSDVSFSGGFQVCRSSPESVLLGLNLFRNIPAFKCNDKEKEMSGNSPICFSNRCGPLSYKSFQGQCILYTTESHRTSKAVHMDVNCSGNKSLDKYIHNDIVVDCAPVVDEEIILKEILLNKTFSLCFEPNLIPCKQHHSKCFHLQDMCVYSLDNYTHLYPCRNGGHLEECASFQCARTYKCSQSYCLTWALVCDGAFDCPLGEDEISSNSMACSPSSACPNMFKCEDTHKCIPLSVVCDTVADCPFGDDEEFCDFKETSCPGNCNCLLYAIFCSTTLFKSEQKLIPFISTTFHLNGDLISISQIHQFPSVLFLSAINSKFSSLCAQQFKLPQNVSFADFSLNLVASLTCGCVSNHSKIRALSIKQNKIRLVSSSSFKNLPEFHFLSLAENPLTTVAEHIFSDLPNVKLLSVVTISYI